MLEQDDKEKLTKAFYVIVSRMHYLRHQVDTTPETLALIKKIEFAHSQAFLLFEQLPCK